MPRKRKTVINQSILAYNSPTVDPGLSRERIVNTALEILQEEGLPKVTTRRIAERLDVNSGSLYWHVKSKEQLMQLIADKICADIDTPDEFLSWREKIRQYAENYRNALLSYRDAAQIFTDTMPFTLNRLRQIEEVSSIFAEAGFSYEEVPLIGILFNNYVMGFVKEEVRLKDLLASQQDSDQIMSKVRNSIKGLPAEEFPTLVQSADYATLVDMDKQFQFGLDIIIEGLTAKLGAHS